jgi:cobalt-zinc-cadmium efflux system outer membrane protein
MRLSTRSIACLFGARTLVVAAIVAAFHPYGIASAQSQPSDELDTLVARAMAVNPAIRAAAARAAAARERIAPAGTWPDPMLMAGAVNQTLGRGGSPADSGMASGDMMEMRMIGVTQRIPYPGKLRLARRAASAEHEAAQAELEQVRRDVVRDVQTVYYDLAFIDDALEIVERNRSVLVEVISATEARYAVGTAEQAELLESRVEAAGLADEAAALIERRNALAARLESLVAGSAPAPAHATIPARIAAAAIPRSTDRIRFTSNVLGARASHSPLPALDVLLQTALRNSASLGVRAAEIRAAAARASLARRAALPDIDFSFQYGQRTARPDMITWIVSAPLPLFKGRRQDRERAAAQAHLDASRSDSAQAANTLRAEVAAAHAEAERHRTRLALYAASVIPQARAALTSATASFQVGRAQFRTLLTSQAALFRYETEYLASLTDFAKAVAELERWVGQEVL